jgi:ribosomal protein L14E/L6E/L27E
MRVGNVVKALAGKEKEQLFVIVRIENKYAYISYGKRLKVNKPKKKVLNTFV